MAQSGLLDSLVLCLVCAYFVFSHELLNYCPGVTFPRITYFAWHLCVRGRWLKDHTVNYLVGLDATPCTLSILCAAVLRMVVQRNTHFLRPFNDDRRSVSSYFGIGISISVFCLYGAALLNVYLLNAIIVCASGNVVSLYVALAPRWNVMWNSDFYGGKTEVLLFFFFW